MTEKDKTIYQLNKFFSKKYKFYKEKKNSNENILLVDRERVDALFPNAIINLAVSKKSKMNVILLTDLESNTTSLKIYRHLGFNKIVRGFNKLLIFKKLNLFIFSIIISFLAIFKIYQNGFKWLIDKYYVKNILIGDLVYDHNIRFHHRYKKTKIDYYFIKLLIKATFRLLVIEEYFRKFNIKRVVVGTETYTFNSGIALRIATFKNIKNYTPLQSSSNSGDFEIINYKKSFIKYGPLSICHDKKNYKKFISMKVKKNKIENFYKKRKNFKTINFLTIKNFKKANKISAQGKKFLKKIQDKKKNVILYASHAFSDSAHFMGINFTFENYYHQFQETLKFISKHDKKNIWIFRSHPASLLPEETQKMKNLVNKYKKENIFMCPSGVPIVSLYKICQSLVTGRGTAGLEFASEGKPIVICGTAIYSGLNIAIEAKSKKHYFKILKNINFFKKLNKKKIFNAKRVIYFLENGFYIKNHVDEFALKKDKLGSNFFKNSWGAKLSILLKNVDKYLMADINKSNAFKKIVDVV